MSLYHQEETKVQDLKVGDEIHMSEGPKHVTRVSKMGPYYMITFFEDPLYGKDTYWEGLTMRGDATVMRKVSG